MEQAAEPGHDYITTSHNTYVNYRITKELVKNSVITSVSGGQHVRNEREMDM